MNARLLALALFLAPAAAAQPSPDGSLAVPTTDRADRSWRPYVTGAALVSNIFESNIDHDPEAIPSVGLVPALHLRVQDRPEKERLTLDYVLARHSYSNTERWDRTSHQVRVAYEHEVLDGLASLSEAELSLRGSSEDRDLANQIQFVQGVEWALSRAIRAQAYGTLRYKTVPGDPEGQAFKPNAGVALQRRWASGARIEIGSRYELNLEPLERGDYRRLRLEGDVRIPMPGRESRIELDASWRIRRYLVRLAEDAEGDAIDAFRVDRKWTAGITWQRDLLNHVGVVAGVEVEQRTSNDAEKHYTATSALLGVEYRF